MQIRGVDQSEPSILFRFPHRLSSGWAHGGPGCTASVYVAEEFQMQGFELERLQGLGTSRGGLLWVFGGALGFKSVRAAESLFRGLRTPKP